MNVWIWGPPLWETLHAGAVLYDSNKRSADRLLRPLKRLLPCKYCRDSYVGFYDNLHDPETGAAAPWVYTVHKLVNAKLQKQRVEAFLARRSWPEDIAAELLESCSELGAEPTLEVLLKRFVVNREEPLVWRSMSTALLALVMGIELSGDTAVYSDLQDFVKALIELLRLSKQDNADTLIDFLESFYGLIKAKKSPSELRAHIEQEKYESILGSTLKTATDASRLVKAGACVSGTCA